MRKNERTGVSPCGSTALGRVRPCLASRSSVSSFLRVPLLSPVAACTCGMSWESALGRACTVLTVCSTTSQVLERSMRSFHHGLKEMANVTKALGSWRARLSQAACPHLLVKSEGTVSSLFPYSSKTLRISGNSAQIAH